MAEVKDMLNGNGMRDASGVNYTVWYEYIVYAANAFTEATPYTNSMILHMVHL